MWKRSHCDAARTFGGWQPQAANGQPTQWLHCCHYFASASWTLWTDALDGRSAPAPAPASSYRREPSRRNSMFPLDCACVESSTVLQVPAAYRCRLVVSCRLVLDSISWYLALSLFL